MTTQRISIKRLHPNEGQIPGLPSNPRQWTQTEIDKIAKSLKETPELFEARPVIVMPFQGEYVILGGNLRYEGCKKNKEKDLPCFVLPETTSVEKMKEIVIKDNGTFGGWDYDALANEWDDLALTDWGVPTWDTEQEAAAAPQEVQEDDFDEEQDEIHIRCKKGEIWQLGEHRLMCGDSTDLESVTKLMGGAMADMVLTDPPYGMFLDTDFSTIKGSLKSIGRKNSTQGNKYEKVIGDNEDFSPRLIESIFESFGYCKEMFLFGADYYAEIIPDKNQGSWLCWDKRKESQADAIGSEFELIWSRNKHKRRMLRHDWFGFLSSQDQEDARNRVHPTQKPISLLVDIMSQWGNDSRVIADLYGGSGSTMMACEQLGKTCYMMELDPHYCDVIIARWEKMTGQEAHRVTE